MVNISGTWTSSVRPNYTSTRTEYVKYNLKISAPHNNCLLVGLNIYHPGFPSVIPTTILIQFWGVSIKARNEISSKLFLFSSLLTKAGV